MNQDKTKEMLELENKHLKSQIEIYEDFVDSIEEESKAQARHKEDKFAAARIVK